MKILPEQALLNKIRKGDMPKMRFDFACMCYNSPETDPSVPPEWCRSDRDQAVLNPPWLIRARTSSAVKFVELRRSCVQLRPEMVPPTAVCYHGVAVTNATEGGGRLDIKKERLQK